MRPRPGLPPGPYLVVGLARSGVAAARALQPHGEVIATDAGSPDVEIEGAEVHLQTHAVDLVERAGAVIKSPGVPAEAAAITAARDLGVPVLGELELAWRLIPNEFIAVTGTNGKTTTAELLGEIHRAAGLAVAVAGNVGTALSSLVGRLDAGAVVVCEASSFQLDDTVAFAPEAAVLLNLSEDHLDRHGTMEDYAAAKLRVFANQEPGDVAVLPAGMEHPGAGRSVPFADEEWEVRLRGAHNRENAMAAAAVALARGIPGAAVERALGEFSGVEHRMEELGELDGVLYVNDSKATNPASARVALEAWDGGVHAILGGSLKGGSFAELVEPVRERCAGVYLIGEAAGQLADELGTGTVCGDLEHAFAAARAAASPGEVVLLSPACASYDQFTDYEERGRRFKELVRA